MIKQHTYFTLLAVLSVLLVAVKSMAAEGDVPTDPVAQTVQKPEGALYLPSRHSQVAVILFHSRNDFPDSQFNGFLRRQINRRLDYHTLALQLPNDNIPWFEYGKHMPTAFRVTRQGIDFLLKQKHVNKIYFLARGMGARFATAYLAVHEAPSVIGLVGITMRNRGANGLNTVANMLAMERRIPVLDIFGNAGKIKYEFHADERLDIFKNRRNYTQVSIPNAGSAFKRHREELMAIVTRWFMARTNQRYLANDTP